MVSTSANATSYLDSATRFTHLGVDHEARNTTKPLVKIGLQYALVVGHTARGISHLTNGLPGIVSCGHPARRLLRQQAVRLWHRCSISSDNNCALSASHFLKGS